MKRRWWLLFFIVPLLPFWGDVSLSLAELQQAGSVGYRVFWELRVPRLILTLSAGAVLSILGVSYQTIFHNPLAEPYLMGVSSAVILGCLMAEMFLVPFAGLGPIAIGAVLGLTVVIALVAMASVRFGFRLERLVLFGMGLNFILSSLVFLTLSYRSQQVGGGAMRWLFGQLPWADPSSTWRISLVAVATLLFLLIFARKLDALSAGDVVARTLGVKAAKWRGIFLGVTSLSLAAVVSLTGTIGFVGLVVPHAVRLALRPQSLRVFLIESFLGGALFLAVCDVLSRILFPPFEFPIGIVTTLVGGPLFLFLLWRK